MQKRFRSFLFFIIVLITIFSFTITAYAYRLGAGKISGGAAGILYYIDSSAGEYDESIRYGIQLWNGRISTVSVNRTTNKSLSRCDNYWGNYFLDYTTIAHTELYVNNQLTYNYDVDWDWCKIKYNSNFFNYDLLSYDQRKGTACHEYGHFLGLAHNNSNIYSIMCQLKYGRKVNSPQDIDVENITKIYGS